ncbi:uncharacterized protein LOC127001495 isoform X2 [Eriocheir sinensis]|uniref:uncharacterized protein LOC127001495 isoform X2 n=1 Tax=Eriocheir sinensis TaxID=95602 RepID=UPI0021C9872E|nr:uncharacterized protein LOC127001495 isoform X2 [Eriocheir sinensis]
MEDLLTGDIRPVRRAPPPPSSKKSGSHPQNDDLLVIDQGGEEGFYSNARTRGPAQKLSQNGLPRSVSLPLNNSIQRRVPPPRPPPPKVNPRNKVHQQLEHSNSSRGGVGGIIGKIRGPSSSRTRQPPGHSSTSAPSTPVSEASLIDLSSPPSSPTTRSGSDGLSVNSFGSESSTGNLSSGFDDIFDPFGSIQENNYSAVPKKVGVSSFYSSIPTSTVSATQDVLGFQESQDPFDTLASKASQFSIQTPQLHSSSTVPSTSQLARPPNPAVQFNQQSTITKPEQKPLVKPTIIRPKAPVSSSQVERAGDNGISSQVNDLGSIDWSAAHKGNAAKAPALWDTAVPHIIDQTIPEEPPPLPPRPEAEEDHDRPHGIAEFEFAGTQPDDLSLNVGDVVQLLYRVSDDWLFGRCGPKEGMFPQCFIKIVVPLAGEQMQSSHSSSSGTVDSTKLKSSPQPAACEVRVLYSFVAETSEDLTVQEGSLVQVTGRLNDQWLYGQCNGKWGQFPANFVESIPPNLPQLAQD